MKKSIVMLVAASAVISGCAGGGRMSDMEMAGAVAGAVLGGFAGSQIGAGTGQMIYTGIGAALGGTAGYVVGRRMDQGDFSFYGKATQVALAKSPDGHTTNWKNPDTGTGGAIRPIATFTAPGGETCRSYRTTVAFADAIESGVGAGCQQADGSWRIVSDDFS